VSTYNFSDAVREVLVAARHCANEFGSGYIEIDHIAIAALESPSREILSYVERLGIEPGSVASDIRSSLRRGPTQPGQSELPYSAAAKAGLETAMRISSHYRHEVVGVDHLLAAVSDKIKILSSAMLDSGVNREYSLELLDEHRSAPPARHRWKIW
jgi:ATP-dependent Clp protease ATP-binding subunit ClpA